MVRVFAVHWSRNILGAMLLCALVHQFALFIFGLCGFNIRYVPDGLDIAHKTSQNCCVIEDWHLLSETSKTT